ncbi:hypothetical protein QTG54_005442 [Skeletonema marinoi]|uniref:Uncharacterized protein n=1 Tax=Skeletonema marinoi TaxID=267567 RepID=A0AAD8YE79_9STRA|nr:hypothetical protein QTG54_005442 [Skeletonema marinoi]
MASKAARIAAVANQIFGTVPNRGVRTGMQYLKKPLTGAMRHDIIWSPLSRLHERCKGSAL